MNPKVSSYTLDMLPPLTAKQREHLNALSEKPDPEIDLTDMRELTDDQLSEMRRPGELYKPIKK